MPESGWLLLGPWSTRFGADPTGPYYLTTVIADGGRATRIVRWHQLNGDHPATELTAADHLNVLGQLCLGYRDLVLSAYDRRTGVAHRRDSHAPLALLVADGPDWAIYLPIRMGGDDGLFMRTGSIFDTQPSSPPIQELVARIPEYATQAGSHESWYFKHNPTTEYEHKFTLAPTTDIYSLARDIRNSVGQDDLSSYRWEYRDDWQTWRFDNYLFSITGPLESDHGYASFIPTLDGRHVLKRKIFTDDGFKRTEIKITCSQPLAGLDDKIAFLTENQGLQASYLGRFQRVRFDTTLEHIDTGHIHSIMVDRCVFPDHCGAVLCQLEIEYLRSRGSAHDCEDEICRELDELRGWCRHQLADRRIPAEQCYLSKYTFLRNLAGVT